VERDEAVETTKRYFSIKGTLRKPFIVTTRLLTLYRERPEVSGAIIVGNGK